MRIRPSNSGQREQGIIITLVAVFMLFVVGAMAALSIDVVTFYTARSEAQIAADSAALAAARVMANSGMTSSTGNSTTNPFRVDTTKTLASAIATQVARQNLVGGTIPSQISVTFTEDNPLTGLNNPRVTVKVTSDLPTFFARIWGTTKVTMSASATAEAYNPSGLVTNGGEPAGVALSCVKPWLLPNIDPNPNAPANSEIFNPQTGTIQDPGLLGFSSLIPVAPDGTSLHAACGGGDCSGGLSTPSAWQYFPADFSQGNSQGNITQATSASVSCVGGAGFTQYQLNVAGCVPTPINCNASNVAIDLNSYPNPPRDADTAFAVDSCLTHTAGAPGSGNPPAPGDSVDPSNPSPPYPFQFLAGTQNPMVPTSLAGNDILVSDSLVTVPVFDSGPPAAPTVAPKVQVIGFVQLFLEPDGFHANFTNMIRTTVINMVGCGTSATGAPVYGNGPSAVPVRLISPQPAN